MIREYSGKAWVVFTQSFLKGKWSVGVNLVFLTPQALEKGISKMDEPIMITQIDLEREKIKVDHIKDEMGILQRTEWKGEYKVSVSRFKLAVWVNGEWDLIEQEHKGVYYKEVAMPSIATPMEKWAKQYIKFSTQGMDWSKDFYEMCMETWR